MSRYFTRPKAKVRSEWDDAAPLLPSLTVDDHQAVDTGIVSISGDAIMRSPNPMGFGREDEW